MGKAGFVVINSSTAAFQLSKDNDDRNRKGIHPSLLLLGAKRNSKHMVNASSLPAGARDCSCWAIEDLRSLRRHLRTGNQQHRLTFAKGLMGCLTTHYPPCRWHFSQPWNDCICRGVVNAGSDLLQHYQGLRPALGIMPEKASP